MIGFAKEDAADEDPDAIVKQLKAILDADIPEKAAAAPAEKKKAFRPPRGAHLGMMLIQSLRSELRDTAGLEPPDEITFKEKPKRSLVPVRKALPKPATIPKSVPEPMAMVRPALEPAISEPDIAPKPDKEPGPKLIRRIAKFSPKRKRPAKARLLMRVPKRKIRKKRRIIAPKPKAKPLRLRPKPKIKTVKALLKPKALKARLKPKPRKAAPKPVRRAKPARRMPKRKLSGRERLLMLLARRRRK